MKIEKARVCIECEELFADGITCPVCGSEYFRYLQHWLDRPEDRDAAILRMVALYPWMAGEAERLEVGGKHG